MSEENLAVKTDSPAAEDKVETPTPTEDGDAEARIVQLEAEKAKLIVESANYKLGMLKAKGKVQEDFEDESEDDRIARIVQEKISETKIAQIDTEKDKLIKQTLRENKELKLALQNKTKDPLATLGTHSESQKVQDTSITPEQMTAFKAKGWTDKDIERYKKNLSRYAK
jgi:hypothetical protein